MKRLTRSEIKAELEKPNGSAEIMNDSTIDKISLCDETTAMFIEENIGSALMIRLAKSRAMLLRMSGNPALLPAMRKALASDASPSSAAMQQGLSAFSQRMKRMLSFLSRG